MGEDFDFTHSPNFSPILAQEVIEDEMIETGFWKAMEEHQIEVDGNIRFVHTEKECRR